MMKMILLTVTREDTMIGKGLVFHTVDPNSPDKVVISQVDSRDFPSSFPDFSSCLEIAYDVNPATTDLAKPKLLEEIRASKMDFRAYSFFDPEAQIVELGTAGSFADPYFIKNFDPFTVTGTIFFASDYMRDLTANYLSYIYLVEREKAPITLMRTVNLINERKLPFIGIGFEFHSRSKTHYLVVIYTETPMTEPAEMLGLTEDIRTTQESRIPVVTKIIDEQMKQSKFPNPWVITVAEQVIFAKKCNYLTTMRHYLGWMKIDCIEKVHLHVQDWELPEGYEPVRVILSVKSQFLLEILLGNMNYPNDKHSNLWIYEQIYYITFERSSPDSQYIQADIRLLPGSNCIEIRDFFRRSTHWAFHSKILITNTGNSMLNATGFIGKRSFELKNSFDVRGILAHRLKPDLRNGILIVSDGRCKPNRPPDKGILNSCKVEFPVLHLHEFVWRTIITAFDSIFASLNHSVVFRPTREDPHKWECIWVVLKDSPNKIGFLRTLVKLLYIVDYTESTYEFGKYDFKSKKFIMDAAVDHPLLGYCQTISDNVKILVPEWFTKLKHVEKEMELNCTESVVEPSINDSIIEQKEEISIPEIERESLKIADERPDVSIPREEVVISQLPKETKDSKLSDQKEKIDQDMKPSLSLFKLRLIRSTRIDSITADIDNSYYQ